MSKLIFKREVDLHAAHEIERDVIQNKGWKPDGPLLFTYITAALVDDVKAELDARGIEYTEESNDTTPPDGPAAEQKSMSDYP